MNHIFIALWIMMLAVSGAAANTLKIGVLLIEDSVPLYVAEKEKFFRDEGVEVELIPFLSALERDSALTAGAIDGAISDPVGAIIFDQGRNSIQITSLCLGQSPSEGVFAILSAPESGIQEVAELKNVPIAVSNGTIIEYVTERLLAEQGFSPEEIATIEVKKMPIRMQMLLSNSVEAATLPEPLASIAEAKGARRLISDANSGESLSQTVIIFRRDVLQQRHGDVVSFHRGLARGVKAINNDKELYRKLFVEKGRIPPFLAQEYVIPDYPLPQPFDRQLYSSVIEWLTVKQLVKHLTYEYMMATDVFAK